jgi:hypothetical protein
MLVHGLTATAAIYSSQIRARRVDFTILVGNMAAPFTLNIWLPLADSQDGYEKER